MKIAIIDYGMGNIHSVAKAVALFQAQPVISYKKSEINSCAKIILPGVGAFDDALAELQRQDLIALIKDQIQQKKPFLGICLGMQLLLEKSQEAKLNQGLGIFSGEVVKFDHQPDLKIPHMGWNGLKIKAEKCPLLKNVANDDQVYFCHSYYPRPVDQSTVASTTDYGTSFASILWKDNVYGTQFHPEKSQTVGLKIIKNFIELC